MHHRPTKRGRLQNWHRRSTATAQRGQSRRDASCGRPEYRAPALVPNRDFAEAAKWFRKAAEQGDADAAEALEQLQKKKGKIFG